MRSFISILGAVLSVLSLSSFARTLPSDPSSGHINIARGFQFGLAPLQVVYGKSSSQEPSNSLKEINGGSNDISNGFSGVNYVWLTQSKTINPTKWIRSMIFRHFRSAEPDQAAHLRTPDLAKGANGDFRYLYWVFAERGDVTTPPPLKEAALYRVSISSTPVPGGPIPEQPPGSAPPPGWSFISADLNQGRGREYLYVVAR